MINKIKQYLHRRTKTSLPPVEVQDVVQTLSQKQGWGWTQLNIPNLWKKTKGEGITIGVIDTGVPQHTDLDENVLEGINCISGENQYDNNGHQTHCVGIISAENNGFGMVGVAPKAKCLCIKGLSDKGSGTYGGLIKALEYCLTTRHDGTKRVDIVSMSLGGKKPSAQMKAVIDKLVAAGIPVICAAGNDGSGGVAYPGAFDNTIAVAAYDKTGKVAKFSSKGPQVDFAKPGVDVYSTYLNNSYARLSGTSMATPFMAGVVALLMSFRKERNKPLSVKQLKNLLISKADDKGLIGKDESWGYGIVDVEELLDTDTPPAPKPTPTPDRPTPTPEKPEPTPKPIRMPWLTPRLTWIVFWIMLTLIITAGVVSYVLDDEPDLPDAPYIDDQGNIDWDKKYELEKQQSN